MGIGTAAGYAALTHPQSSATYLPDDPTCGPRPRTTRPADHVQTTDHRKTVETSGDQRPSKTWPEQQKRPYYTITISWLSSLVKRRPPVRIRLPAPQNRRSDP
jgi:hypothetical protein